MAILMNELLYCELDDSVCMIYFEFHHVGCENHGLFDEWRFWSLDGCDYFPKWDGWPYLL